MKSKPLALLALTIAFVLTGCWQKSLHPFYKDSDLAYDEKLIGTWKETKEDPKDGMTWRVEKGDSPTYYQIDIEDGDMKLAYEGRLFKLGNERLLDVYSRARPVGEIAAHNLFRVTELTDTLTVQTLDLEWFSKYVQAHPTEIEHIKLSDPDNPNNESREIALTAKTQDLQKFLTKHMNDEKFWSDPGKLKRVVK
jgi:hypothetical protein